MSRCLGCYDHESDYLWNRCNYFEMECFYEPEECRAFSIDGVISEEAAKEIYNETNGMFGSK